MSPVVSNTMHTKVIDFLIILFNFAKFNDEWHILHVHFAIIINDLHAAQRLYIIMRAY